MSENKSIAQYGKVKEFSTNEIVFFQGSIGEEMHIVLQGNFGVYLNSMSDFPLRVSEIGPSSFFGEMALIDNEPRSATIIAEENSKTLCVSKKDFLPLIAENTQITTSMLKTLGKRYRSTYAQLVEQGKNTDDLKEYDNIDDEMIAKIIGLGSETAYKFIHNFSKLLRVSNERLLQDSSTEPDAESELLKEDIRLLPSNYPFFDKMAPKWYTKYTYEKATTCWVCGHHYNLILPNNSELIAEKTDYDTRPHHKRFDLLWYSTRVCPNCNYAALTTTQKNINPDVYKQIRSDAFKKKVEKLGEIPVIRSIDQVIKSYYLAKLCNQLSENNVLTNAKIMLRLYWLYQDLDAEELQLEAANEALKYYDQYVSTAAVVSDLNYVQINIIMAEIYAKRNDYYKARSLYHKNLMLGRKVHTGFYEQSYKRFHELKILQEEVENIGLS